MKESIQPSNVPHTLLTVEQIAETLGIETSTIHSKKWQQRTGCPLRKIGRRLYCITSEFNIWLEDYTKLNIKKAANTEVK
jgi:hypothetical protein